MVVISASLKRAPSRRDGGGSAEGEDDGVLAGAGRAVGVGGGVVVGVADGLAQRAGAVGGGVVGGGGDDQAGGLGGGRATQIRAVARIVASATKAVVIREGREERRAKVDRVFMMCPGVVGVPIGGRGNGLRRAENEVPKCGL